MRMGLREANQRFSKAIQSVRQGEEVVLTERGKPIAVISPLTGARDVASIRKLEHAGFLRPAAKPKPLPAWKPRRIVGEPLSKTISRERDRLL
jgi:prevent-host-death family protein